MSMCSMPRFSSSPARTRTRRRWLAGALAALLLLGSGGWWLKMRLWGAAPLPIPRGTPIDAPAELARWPWRGVRVSRPHLGVTRWHKLQRDGTLVELLEFDFKADPGLHWAIADQDENDDKPFDNRVDFWDRSAAVMSRELNHRFAAHKQGKVVAAWNGAFFGYDVKTNSRIAFHVSPVVLNGQAHYAKGANHRWTVGTKTVNGKTEWKVVHLPPAKTLAQQFDWAAGSVQCLVKDGKPLHLQPFPHSAKEFLKAPVPSTPQDVGHIPDFDHMKSCRASLAWNRDSSTMWLLIVKEPDTESASITMLRRGLPMGGGWMVSDLQKFWMSRKVWCAVNSDAGDVGQRLLLLPNGSYDWIPPRLVSGKLEMPLKPDLSDAPAGGAPLMTFYVRDARG